MLTRCGSGMRGRRSSWASLRRRGLASIITSARISPRDRCRSAWSRRIIGRRHGRLADGRSSAARSRQASTLPASRSRRPIGCPPEARGFPPIFRLIQSYPQICGATCLQIVGIRFVRLADRDSILLSGQAARSDPKPENPREIKDFFALMVRWKLPCARMAGTIGSKPFRMMPGTRESERRASDERSAWVNRPSGSFSRAKMWQHITSPDRKAQPARAFGRKEPTLVGAGSDVGPHFVLSIN